MTTSRYPVPAKWHRKQTEVKRSRFITTVANTATRESSRSFIQKIRSEFSDANHNCWACVIGAPGSTLQAGMSDDGEPHGAAGKPMLTTMLHANIGDITVVVSRYFGGIRLGKGGMVRAYTAAVLDTLATLPTTEKISYQRVDITIPYKLLEQVEQLYHKYEIVNPQLTYSDLVHIELQLPVEHCDMFNSHLNELSAGGIVFNKI
ncbi:MAG: YigZ family protein [Desulfobacteraceae bacterium 4572_35.1]|nr:MAG: YigZ family protein [Desulfobacteraceae bacterium 4572_35.1]